MGEGLSSCAPLTSTPCRLLSNSAALQLVPTQLHACRTPKPADSRATTHTTHARRATSRCISDTAPSNI